MRLAVLIQRRCLWTTSHARAANLVNDDAAVGNAVRPLRIGLVPDYVCPAGSLDNGAEGFLHILRHLDFVVAPLPVKAQHGNAPLVYGIGIDIAVAVFVGNHFAASAEADGRAVHAAAFLLEGGAVSLEFFAHMVKLPDPGHAKPAAEFDVVAAQKVILAVELPPRHVHVHAAYAIVIVAGHFFQLGKES